VTPSGFGARGNNWWRGGSSEKGEYRRGVGEYRRIPEKETPGSVKGEATLANGRAFYRAACGHCHRTQLYRYHLDPADTAEKVDRRYCLRAAERLG
jgi:mono/diheme cytochrome c family protein